MPLWFRIAEWCVVVNLNKKNCTGNKWESEIAAYSDLNTKRTRVQLRNFQKLDIITIGRRYA